MKEVNQSLEKLYIDAICLAKTWVMEAELKGDEVGVAAFTRILDYALEQYKNSFGSIYK